MTRLALFVLFLNFFFPAAGQDLEVIIKNIRDDKGQLMVAIFNSEKTFLKTPWRGELPKAQKGMVKVIFKDIPAGAYALSVIHDENENKKLETNFMGIRKEGSGFSNDVMGTFGPPSFGKAKITMPVSQPITITLKYM